MNYDFQNLLQELSDGLYLVDGDRQITFWNAAAERITGFTAAEVMGRRCSDNILMHVDAAGNSLCTGMCPLAHTIEDGQPRSSEIFLHHKQGHRVPVWVRVTPLRDTSGRLVGAAELFTDQSPQHLTQLRLLELEKLALIDPLTRLSNRRHMEAELAARFEEMRRYSLTFGLLFFDIDDFKAVNDTYGHEAGDRVLEALAATIHANARPFDLFGRWGGEEFVGILRSVGLDQVGAIGDRFRVLIERTQAHLPGCDLAVTVSMGATVARADDTIARLVQRADGLMYASKRAGKNRVTAGA